MDFFHMAYFNKLQNNDTEEKKMVFHLCCIFVTTLEDKSDGTVHPTL